MPILGHLFLDAFLGTFIWRHLFRDAFSLMPILGRLFGNNLLGTPFMCTPFMVHFFGDSFGKLWDWSIFELIFY